MAQFKNKIDGAPYGIGISKSAEARVPDAQERRRV